MSQLVGWIREAIHHRGFKVGMPNKAKPTALPIALLHADLQTFTLFRFQNFQPKMLGLVYYQPEIELINCNQWLLFSNSTKAWTMIL
jgi:hypothetical protein